MGQSTVIYTGEKTCSTTGDAAVFSIISRCFTNTSREEWEQLTTGFMWADFLDDVRGLTQTGRRLGDIERPIERLKPQRPLQDALSNQEVGALFTPPTYEEKCSFAARHFTGGLPESAMPVESLYVEWQPDIHGETLFSRAKGFYLANTATYMADMIEAVGGSIPSAFSACPDHLSLELDFAAVLLRSFLVAEAQQFIVERLAWLTAYRMKLLSLHDDASFYIALVDVLIAVREQQAGELDESTRLAANVVATSGTYQRGKSNVG